MNETAKIKFLVKQTVIFFVYVNEMLIFDTKNYVK